MKEALETSWAICVRPHFASALVIWLSRLGLPVPTSASTWWQIGDIGSQCPLQTENVPSRSGPIRGMAHAALFAIPRMLRDGLYDGRSEWWERVGCCRILSGSTISILAYYSNLVIGDDSGATAVWPLAA